MVLLKREQFEWCSFAVAQEFRVCSVHVYSLLPLCNHIEVMQYIAGMSELLVKLIVEGHG